MVKTELYDEIEILRSNETLAMILKEITEPPILLGGWAVYFTVNDNFEKEYGNTYLGSRDLDLGFLIDKKATQNELFISSFARTQKVLEKLGFHPYGGSRYRQIFHSKTDKRLSLQDSINYDPAELTYYFVDLIVDNIHPDNDELFKIKPLDEPILSFASENDLFIELKINSRTILVPEPYVLLATKLSSFPKRSSNDKKIKDACDIYALLWSSPVEFLKNIELIQSDFAELCQNALKVLNRPIIKDASRHLGIHDDEFTNVIKRILE